jgi:uroporphyrinogen-III synthase
MPPILLLKTKSTPHDGYEDLFSRNYDPTFVPVLEHRFHTENLNQVRDLFVSGAFGDANPNTNGNDTENKNRKYGGLIFTSQRAVEGFAKMIEDEKDGTTPIPTQPQPQSQTRFKYKEARTYTNKVTATFNIPTTKSSPPLLLYTVGPATARSLTTLRNKHLPNATIYGADAGTGENLAHMILEHYNGLYPSSTSTSTSEGNPNTKPALLFLVGEVRRDIIPKTLMNPELREGQIGVEELVVYETGVMGSFEGDFGGCLQQIQNQDMQSGVEVFNKGDVVWVVVFSPTGCEAMLRVLGLGPFSSASASGSGAVEGKKERRVFIATIGPTTRDHLRSEFGFEAHVCAPKPSPEGVAEGIEKFMNEL